MEYRIFTFLQNNSLKTILIAQEAIQSAGGDATGSGGSMSYSIGQMVYSTNTDTNGSVAEGGQQPYEISVVVGIEQSKDINLRCTAYPNPAQDILFLEVQIADIDNYSFQLYDMMGKLLVGKELTDISTTISMANLAPAIYFLKVSNNHKVVKTFKIIKTQ